jgi:hypothetical protein
MMKAERENLKQELLHLKKCQIQYFILSITASGAIAGFGGKIGEATDNAIYLAPLLVILPCWWIFFDKGATITRIIGYFRLLEGMIIRDRTQPFAYIGWENALSLFRMEEQSTPLKTKTKRYFEEIWEGFIKGLTFRTTHKYWVICWYTFLGLGLVSFSLSKPVGNILHIALWWIFLCLFLISIFHNLRVLGRLISGSYSIVANHEQWKKILRSDRARRFLYDMFAPT